MGAEAEESLDHPGKLTSYFFVVFSFFLLRGQICWLLWCLQELMFVFA